MARENVEKILRKFEKETRVFAWVIDDSEDETDGAGGKEEDSEADRDGSTAGVSGDVQVWWGGLEQPQGGVGVSTSANEWRRHIFPPGFVRRQPAYLVWTSFPHPPPNDWSSNRPGYDFDDVL